MLMDMFFISSSTESETDQRLTNPTSEDEKPNEKTVESFKPHVRFHKIFIREYPRTVGDHPSVSAGPPLTLDWDYNPDTEILTIEDYEAIRPERRNKFELIVPRNLREKILKFECGVSSSQIAQSIRSVRETKAKRRQTANNLNFSKAEEKIEALKRTIGRVVGVRKSSEREMEILWEQASVEPDKKGKKKTRPQTPRYMKNQR